MISKLRGHNYSLTVFRITYSIWKCYKNRYSAYIIKQFIISLSRDSDQSVQYHKDKYAANSIHFHLSSVLNCEHEKLEILTYGSENNISKYTLRWSMALFFFTFYHAFMHQKIVSHEYFHVWINLIFDEVPYWIKIYFTCTSNEFIYILQVFENWRK